jgi:chromosome segregation ATPase
VSNQQPSNSNQNQLPSASPINFQSAKSDFTAGIAPPPLVSQNHSIFPPRSNGAGMADIENTIELERRRLKETKDRCDRELDQERKLRLEAENKLLRLKDEMLKKEMAWSELDFKANNLVSDNQILAGENGELKRQFATLQERTNIVIRELEEKLNTALNQLAANDDDYKMHVEKLMVDHAGEMDALHRDWTERFMHLEESFKHMKSIKDALENELKDTQEGVMRMKMEHEEALRALQARIQDEENRRFNFAVKQFENKLKEEEAVREAMNRRVQEMIRDMQHKERQVQEQCMFLEGEAAKFRKENGDLRGQIHEAETAFDRMKTEMLTREEAAHKTQSELMECQRTLQKFKDVQKSEIDKIQHECNNERRLWEEERERMTLQMIHMDRAMQDMKAELTKTKQDYETLGNQLHNNISKIIMQTVTENPLIKGLGIGGGQPQQGGQPGGNAPVFGGGVSERPQVNSFSVSQQSREVPPTFGGYPGPITGFSVGR